MARDKKRQSEYMAEYRTRPHEKAKRAERSKRELQENPERIKRNIINYNVRLKREVFEAYGNRCACCGEDNQGFLTIDHVNGRGVDQRRDLKSGRKVYAWAKKNGYPDTLRLLCWNCNCGRHHNGGVCPHMELKNPVWNGRSIVVV